MGKIRSSNISRDFGKHKAGPKAIVGENANEDPAKWYLKAEGTKAVEKQIEDLKKASS